MTTNNRRYDIDWLRVIAIGLLLVYHIGIVFQPWGVFLGFLQNDTSLESLWPPMALLNIWRIPLLFFVSGMGVYFALRKRNWKQLLGERTRRILIPFLFGMLVIVPFHVLIWQKYYNQDTRYAPSPGHLWFLGNIYLYVLILSPLFFYLKRKEQGRTGHLIKRLLNHPVGLMGIPVLFIAETLLVRPETYAMFAFTLHGFLTGFLAFLFGFLLNWSGQRFWENVRNGRWFYMSAAMALYLVRYFVFHLETPDFLTVIESILWIFAALGVAYRYLNRPGRAVRYLSQAAYPVYILHMVFLYLGSSWILPMELDPWFKFILVNLITFAGCFGTYELIVRRISFLRPLFGLKPEKRSIFAQTGDPESVPEPLDPRTLLELKKIRL